MVEDSECVWSDGEVGGYCCEIYSNGIEIGNLVNPMGHSTDVGFGWERLVACMEKVRVDSSSLFDLSLSPVYRDHVRTLELFWENGIEPGNKGRNYICRKLLRRILDVDYSGPISGWLDSEQKLRAQTFSRGERMLRRHRDKPDSWWWETCGLLPEDVALLKGQKGQSEKNEKEC